MAQGSKLKYGYLAAYAAARLTCLAAATSRTTRTSQARPRRRIVAARILVHL